MLADDDEYVKAFDIFKGSSHLNLRKAFALVTQAAIARKPFLICGETGTGKEVVARAIHAYAATDHDRRYGTARPFVPVNCANLPTELVESELFGHLKGAFTGATPKQGLFSQADKGTIFLDEIGEMRLELQAKLLRVLDSMEIRPVGSTAPQKIDVMVIAATNRDIIREVQEGRFREDLFHRLAVARVDLPPLRERSPEEIQALADYHVRRNTPHGETRTFSPQARAAIAQYAWPGNVRELENRVGLAAVMSQGEEISSETLGLDGENQDFVKLEKTAQDRLVLVHWLVETLIRDIKAKGKDLERLKGGTYLSVMQLALSACDNDPSRAAQALGVEEGDFRQELKDLAKYRDSRRSFATTHADWQERGFRPH